MAKFEVTVQQLNTTINELTAENTDFRARVNELLELQQELSAEWTGDANTAFTNAFNNDKSRWDEFAVLIDQYISTLTEIMNNYNTAEDTNTQTATTRTSC